MLMKDGKKGLALLVASKMGKSMEEAPKSEDGGEQDSSMGYKSAAEEILKAVESKDSSMLVEALKSFVDMCSSEPEQREEQSEGEQQPE
jgi:hypothetical protein